VPIFEFDCPLRHDRVERFFHSRDQAEISAERCRKCGARKMIVPSVPCFSAFKPFTTFNLDPSGRPIHVRDRAQLRELQRRFGVREASVNDDKYLNEKAECWAADNRRRKMESKKTAAKMKVERIGYEEAQKIAQECERTSYGMRR
jgi:hypothetical protein